MNIRIRKSAIKDLRRITPDQKRKIHQKILTLKNFPNVSNVKKLTHFEPAYRLRAGSFRILFDVFDDTIEIGRVLHRKESYK
ncbi:MAG: type II toxin-antitoxin system RelE/ParE family toxin [Mariniphaga sp.]|nr:type II toxin-antitoxin system RelE/ParE family toxin [Mariniphaga sp.]